MKDIGHFLLWGYKDTEQMQQIEALKRKSYNSLSEFEKLSNLQWRVDNLVLLNQAMWTILRDKLGLEEEELIKKFEELDLLDGKKDGRMATTYENKPWQCSNCQKENSARFQRCVRCDHPTPRLGATEAFKKIT